MSLENITAENMRKLVNKNSDDDINDLLLQIKTLAENGETSLYLSNYGLKKTIKEELERRGFKVEIGGRYNDIDTIIKWD